MKFYYFYFVCVIYQVRRADPNILTALTWEKKFISNFDYDGPPRYKQWWKQMLASVLDRIWELHLHSWVYDFLGVGVFLSHTAHLSRFQFKNLNNVILLFNQLKNLAD